MNLMRAPSKKTLAQHGDVRMAISSRHERDSRVASRSAHHFAQTTRRQDMAARQTRNGAATVAHFDEIPSHSQPDTSAEWKPVRRFFDLGSFGVSLYVGHAPGEVLTSEHTESD